MQAELAALPETLRQFKEGVANLRAVSQRLADVTEAMERLSPLSPAAAADAARRLEDAFARVQTQAATARATIPGADTVNAAIEELGRAVSAMADLNPLLRPFRSPRPNPPNR